MTSTSSVRFCGQFLLQLCVTISLCTSVLCGPFFYPSNDYQTQYYYNNNPPVQGNVWPQPALRGYNYGQGPNLIAPTAADRGGLSQRVNYYGAPQYDDYLTRVDNRNYWNDASVREYWNNYYKRYYNYGPDPWNDRSNYINYYIKRRQDTAPETTIGTTTVATIAAAPHTITGVRKKKLFVPNVWG